MFEEDEHERVKYASQIASLCLKHHISVTRTRRIRSSDADDISQRFSPDVIFCCGWRTLFPEKVLSIASRGVVGAHDSLLPRFRGFAPTNWALILGNSELGVSVFQMTSGTDEGDVYFQRTISVTPLEPMDQIYERIAVVAVSLFDLYLDAVCTGTLTAIPQLHDHATYCCSRTPEDGEIEWTASSNSIAGLIRALSPPGPGAYTFFDGRIVRVLKATALTGVPNFEGRIPGRVVATSTETVDVLTGDGILRVQLMEFESGVPVAASQIIKSVRVQLGIRTSIEVSRVYSMLAELEKRHNELLERFALLEAQFRRQFVPGSEDHRIQS